ncbi:1-acyl-sn-glycerol-3-phosphate acyltransferase [Trueperella sp. LYQ143]|uniref:1-acyl-sn-glycerol-3-phosphate acyltransferase n=1 Tax=unclassified Trueperella TaxID=2630174 RepID=UPI0039835852
MGIKRFISRTYQKFSRWNFEPISPLPEKGIIIGAYHTSYWDGWFMLMAMWDLDMPFKFLVKDSLARGPIGPIIRAVGGIGVNRSAASGMVSDIADQLRATDGPFQLVLAPEGTRKQREYWKSGFYYIALNSGLPVTLAYIDSQRKSYGWTKTITLSGDVAADMDVIREYYRQTSGFHPERNTLPRLRSEDTENS